MALSDPTTIVFDGDSSIGFARTDLAKNKGTFVSPDGTTELNISSSFSAKSGALAHVRLDRRKPVVDPVTGVTKISTGSVWFVARRPDNGTWSAADVRSLTSGLLSLLTSSNFDRILVGEA